VANEIDRKSRQIATAEATGLVARVALIVGSVLFSLMVLEMGVRLLRAGPEGLAHWGNYARERMGIPEESGPCIYAYDATLGWKAPGNCVSPIYNSDADGFRRASEMGAPAKVALAEPPILATGASFTKGDEVGDGESWPAYLQELTGREVLNAGVSGYSFDQTVLSTEAFARGTKPLVIVVSFTPDDIRRSEYKVSWSREKPYFEVVSGDGGGARLEPRNVPVPGRPGAPVPMPLAARLLGWSALADEVAKRLGIFQGWYYDEVRAVPPGTGPTIACLLMPRLAKLGAPVVIMAQYGRSYWRGYADREKGVAPAVRKVLGCASDAGLIAFDLADPLKAVIDARGSDGRGLDALYRTDHHATAGNRVVA
jgi:hypothetical protein